MRDETIFPDFEEKIANNFETICTFSDAERNLSIWRTLYIMQYLQGKREKEREVSEDGGDRSRGEYKYEIKYNGGKSGRNFARERERGKFQFNDFLYFVDGKRKVCLTREILLRRDRFS